MEYYIHLAVEYLALSFGTLGALIITIGAGIAIIHFLMGVFEKHTPGENITRLHIDPVRVELGRYINFGLDFFIAKDILETIVVPGWSEVGQLLLLVIIRTIVSYFLMYEIDRIETRLSGTKK